MKKGGTKSASCMWQTNEAPIDRAVRFLIAEFLILFAYFWLGLNTVTYLMYIIGTLLLITSITGYSWIYYFFNINTFKIKNLATQTLLIIVSIYILLLPLLIVMMRALI
ncbi:hypothetical protein COT94_02150 [Candidatus Falkowbacteria bacterium CG10_big_fil_rev_8_21_14_0_10_37_14]|uniref:Inner membrane protein YgaP-like transmembrane domain-containing protein n=1 Tax=Candidatus Falkowbacteria bacterium CG10_big_fil_rev_8_21_14_0_10_37_14 TaxID=1974561 RepID=A0A2M6WTC6_9BACT|nr:DUF2892 domain-containing protein [Candidatus Falkowbacteria bacterium]PIT96043.1 MAG: hypothetical protein COT94_02150 [Candidatus Falkowbacteria bacterium CG10_big_fil_rev_8_21_14_0_10_37_14]